MFLPNLFNSLFYTKCYCKKKKKPNKVLFVDKINQLFNSSYLFKFILSPPTTTLKYMGHLLMLSATLEPAQWLSGRMFANGPGDWGSISGRVIPKPQKVVPETSLLNTQHYKVRFKGKVEQSREKNSTLPYTLV